MNKRVFHCIVKGLISLTLAACAAGGGETGTGQDSNTITVGVITGFGSVYVNGIKYETSSNTNVTLDNVTLTESKLKVGMVVTLAGNVNPDGTTGSALSISFDDNVEGMVLENTVSTNNQLSILGQIIIVDNFDTVFESSVPAVKSFAQIQKNNIVEVSGYTSGEGTIYATRIEVKQESRLDGDEITLEGLVSNVNGMEFKIGSMNIVYTLENLDNFDGASLKNGDYVEVKSNDPLNDSGQLIASKVELKSQHKTQLESVKDKALKLEGVITSVQSDTEFSLNGQSIIIDSTTKIENSAQIAIGKKAKVEGKVNESKQIVATEIEIKQENKTKIEGLITAINTDMKTITVAGGEVSINNSTTVKDERDGIEDNNRHFFNFKDLKIGNRVEVSYYTDSNSTLIATKLELKDIESGDDGSAEGNAGSTGQSGSDNEQKTDWEIKDIISSYNANNNTIELPNRTIDISRITDFIGVTAIGKEAEVKGIILSDGSWVAIKLEVKNAEDEPAEKHEFELKD